MIPPELVRARYVSLTTYRRNGEAVPTPVWACADDARLYVWTTADSGKVKRIRATGRVGVTPCDVRGRIAADAPAAEGRATLLDEAGLDRVRALMAKKYGIQFRVLDLLGALRGGVRKGRAAVEITL